MLRSTLRLARPMVNYQANRGIAQDIKSGLVAVKDRLVAVKMSDFTRLLPELGPPTPAEVPRAIRDLTRLFKERNWRNVTMREAWLNTLVTTEVVCWFFLGECIGKGSLIGYQV